MNDSEAIEPPIVVSGSEAIEPPIVSESRVAAAIRVFMLVLICLVLPMLLLAATTPAGGCGGG